MRTSLKSRREETQAAPQQQQQQQLLHAGCYSSLLSASASAAAAPLPVSAAASASISWIAATTRCACSKSSAGTAVGQHGRGEEGRELVRHQMGEAGWMTATQRRQLRRQLGCGRGDHLPNAQQVEAGLALAVHTCREQGIQRCNDRLQPRACVLRQGVPSARGLAEGGGGHAVCIST